MQSVLDPDHTYLDSMQLPYLREFQQSASLAAHMQPLHGAPSISALRKLRVRPQTIGALAGPSAPTAVTVGPGLGTHTQQDSDAVWTGRVVRCCEACCPLCAQALTRLLPSMFLCTGKCRVPRGSVPNIRAMYTTYVSNQHS